MISLPLPPKLYHAARSDRLVAILSDGLRPRSEHGLDGVWHNIPVCPQSVYLYSDSHDVHDYASEAQWNAGHMDIGQLKVLEIDTAGLDRSLLYLDHEELDELFEKHRWDYRYDWQGIGSKALDELTVMREKHSAGHDLFTLIAGLTDTTRRQLASYGLHYHERLMYKGAISPKYISLSVEAAA